MKRIAYALTFMVIFGLLGIAAPAQATTFNIPKSADRGHGTKKTQEVFINTVVAEINRSKPGKKLTVSTYGLSDWGVNRALVRAKNRGVKVRVLSWDGDSFNAMADLVKRFPTNPRASSWAIRSDGSPASKKKNKGVHHLKVVTSETTGRTILSSGNLTNTGATKWNEHHSSYDKKIYREFTKWVEALAYDKNVKSPKSFRSGGWKVDFLPGGPDNRAKEISKVDCRAYKLNGRKVRPVIEVASMIWTDARNSVAQALVKKRQQGCTVFVALTPKQTESKPLKTLRKGKVRMWASDGEIKMHAKPVIIRSKKVNRVISGTANLGGDGVNTNAILTLDSKSEVTQHMQWFSIVLANSKVYK